MVMNKAPLLRGFVLAEVCRMTIDRTFDDIFHTDSARPKKMLPHIVMYYLKYAKL
jgi:hypothetical protein